MANVARQAAHPRARRLAGRYFLRARNASQIKNPIVKIAKPTNAISCCTLAPASENPVCASIISSPSAGSSTDHVHGKFKTQEHQIDDSYRENYLYAQQCFDLRLIDDNQ